MHLEASLWHQRACTFLFLQGLTNTQALLMTQFVCVVQSLCSWSLVELYRALGSSVEAHKAVLASHPMYANLMERSLAKVVLQRLNTLEKFCQVSFPALPALYLKSVLCLLHLMYANPM